MHSGRKRSLSPPAIQGTRPRKAPRPNGRAGGRVEQRVAPVEQVTAPYNTPGGGDSPAFIFGNTQATRSFTFVSRHAFQRVASPSTVVRGVQDITSSVPSFDANISPFGGDDSSQETTSSDKELMAVSTTVVTPVLSNSPTPEFYPVFKESIEESAPADDLMECTIDLGSPPGPTSHNKLALTTGEIIDEERSELSYASYDGQHPTDHSIGSPSPDDPGMNETAPRGRKAPYVAISSREHSLYQAHRRESDVALTGLLDTVDAPRRLSNSGKRFIGEGAQVSNQPTDVEHASVDAQTELTGPVASAINLLNAAEVREVDDPMGARHPSSVAANRRSYGPFSEVYSAPLDIKGSQLFTGLHDRTETGNITADARVHLVDDGTAPTHSPMHGGAVLPPVDMRTSPAPLLHRVRVRGVFVIGNGAPIKIDEGIEVHLRDGVDGQIDFII